MSEHQHFFRYASNEKTEFLKWLDESVFLDEDDYRSTLKRKEALSIFYTEGLVPFIEDHGYIFTNTIPILSHLAFLLFHNSRDDFLVQPFFRLVEKLNIDYEYFDTRGIPSEDWEGFWKTWGKMTDFFEERQKNQYWMPIFCYNRLNLNQSRTTDTVDREYNFDGTEDEGLDQMNEGLARVKDKKGLY